MTLVGGGGPQHAEHGYLRSRVGQIEVLPPIHHQHWLLHAGCEVDGIGLGRHLPSLESTREQDARAQAGFDRQVHRSELRAETKPIQGDAGAIDIRTCLQIVYCPPNILPALNADLAQEALSAWTACMPLIHLLVYRVHHRTPASDNELQKLERYVATRWKYH